MDVAAAFVVERDRPGAIEPVVISQLTRAEALSFSVGAAIANPAARPLVERAWTALAAALHGVAADALGDLLARIDLAWAAALLAPELQESGAGGRVALVAEAAGLPPELPADHAANRPSLRMLCDALREPDAMRTAIVASCRAGAWLERSFTAQALELAACALVDPGVVVDELVGRALWLEHDEVFGLAARTLHARGGDERLRATMPPPGPAEPRAIWLETMIREGVLAGEPARALVRDALELTARDAEAEHEIVDCYPLLSALATLGLSADLLAAVDQLRVPPGLLAELLFAVGDAGVAADVLVAFDRVLAQPRWGAVPGWSPGWWIDAEQSGTTRDVSKQVIALAGHAPWQALPPGTVDDLLDLLRRAIADQR